MDYSETVNKFTSLDAYPLPRLDDTINRIAQYQIFSTVDLKSAYHQISNKDSDKPYTAFEANGSLYQFKRIHFGVTNGVVCFQRAMDIIIKEESLENTFAYLDNIFIVLLIRSNIIEILLNFKLQPRRDLLHIMKTSVYSLLIG